MSAPRHRPSALSAPRVLLTALGALAVLLGGCSTAAPAASGAPSAEVFAAVPWTAGERLEYRLLNIDGTQVGLGVLTTQPSADGRQLVLGQAYSGMPAPGVAPASDTIALTVDAQTLVPVQGVRETVAPGASGTSDAATTTRTTWEYRPDGERSQVTIRVEGARGSEAGMTVGALDGPMYDNESSLWLWRGVPFVEGFEAPYVSVDAFARAQQRVSLRVPQQEEVTVPAGTFETWRILLRNGRAVRTAWISMAPPHEVVRWDNGDVIFELLKTEY